MAECRSCGKEIPEGTLYCNECETRMKADESYLDSLLSSVVANSAEPIPERPVKKTTAEPVPSAFAVKEEPEEISENVIDETPDELFYEPETATESYDELIEESSAEFYDEVSEEAGITEMPLENVPEESEFDFFATMPESMSEESFETVDESTEDLESELDFYDDGIQEERYDIFNDTDDSFLDDLFESTPVEDIDSENETISSEDELLEDLLRSVDDAEAESFDLAAMQADAAAYDGTVQADSVMPEEEPEAFAFSMDEMIEQTAEENVPTASVFESYDEALDAEAAMLGAALAEEVFAAEDVAESIAEPEDKIVPDDFFGMLSSQEPEEVPMEEDPFAMLGITTEPSGTVENFESDSVDDDMSDIWGLINSNNAEDSGTSAFGDFPELFGTDDDLMNIPEATVEENVAAPEVPEKKKKPNIFKRIFGNIREELTEEEIEERKRLALEKFEEDELKAADEAAREKLNKEQKAKQKEEEAAQKQAEKEALAKKKAEEKRAKAEEKRLLKDKKEQAKRALLAEIEENEGKINKFGASIIIVMFAAVLCLITIGTSYYNYKISIDKAQFDFDLQRYDDAYNDVYGLEIKEEDMELYDKIMTVQYVNVQLLSYMRYHSLDMDAEALDSLIKGLRRYEKFIQHGTELGVKNDLNYLKTQIVEQLDEVFGIDEVTAYEMLALETQEEYSVQIYDIVSKKN